MALDVTKQMEVYDTGVLAAHVVYSIGAGSTASVVLPTLARMGCDKFIIWDKDTVDPHNISNQAYTEKQIGMNKVDALAMNLKAINKDVKVQRKCDWWTPESDPKGLRGIVLSLADKMEVRRQILDNLNPEVALYIDTRTGLFQTTCYASLPEDTNRIANIKAVTMDTDEEIQAIQEANGEVSACGLTQSVFPTIQAAGALVAARVIEWMAQGTVSMYSATNYLECTAFKMPMR